MRRVSVLALGILFVLGMTMSALARQGHNGQHAMSGPGWGWGPHFIDQNGDGICDHFHGGASLVDIAANLIGKDRVTLLGELRAGETFAQILTANGKSTSDLVSAVMARRKTAFDQAVAAGQISRAQADERLKAVETQVEQVVTGQSQAAGPGAGSHCPWGAGAGMHHGGRWY
jgi:hypothetical protein